MLAEGLRDAFVEHGVPVTALHVGPVVQVMPGVTDATTFSDFLAADQGLYDTFIVEMLRRGQFILPAGRWYISAAHTDADIMETVAAARESLAAIRDAKASA